MVTLTRFTPSLLDHETLERLFVNREPLLDHVLARIERATRSDERSHTLWVGPRGAGKTHLLSLVYHRARQLPGRGTTFHLAWLPEDPWAVDTLDDLYREVLEHLEPAIAEADRSERPEDDLVRAARQRGPIVVLVENLDQVFDAIGDDGQRRFRALLETDRPLLLVATATRLTEHLVSQAEPFYGFFDTTTLEPFDVDEAAAMLKAIARLDDDQALVYRLDQRSTRARLAAIEHLAGGQPRVWALLGSGLSIETLGELVTVLLERFDDLTPYYQEQLGRLSPHERKVVRTLAAEDRAMTVRDLATTTGINQQSLARTITNLRRHGWLRPRTGLLADMVDQRLRYYELAEPLVRLAFQLKSARGAPVKLILDFLTAWFDREEFRCSTDEPSVEIYLQAAQNVSSHDPLVILCHDLSEPDAGGRRLVIHSTVEQFAPAVLDDNPPMVRMLVGLDDALKAFGEGNAVPLLEQPAGLSRLIEHRLASTSPTRLRLELSDLALRRVVEDPRAWVARAEDALRGASSDDVPTALVLLVRWQLRAGQRDAAELLVHRTIEAVRESSTPGATGAVIAGAKTLIRSGELEVAHDLLVGVEPVVPIELQLRLGFAFQGVSFRAGRPAEGVAPWEKVVQRMATSLGPDHPDTLASKNNLATAYETVGDLDRAIPLHEAALAGFERVLGSDHPVTLLSKSNLAYALGSAGDFDRATPLHEATLASYKRVFGPSHLQTLIAENNLAYAYRSAGDLDRAIPLFEVILANRERTLGPDHPLTVSITRALSACREMREETTQRTR